MKRSINKKGSVTLEAALLLPILVLGVLSLGYYINVYSVMENVAYSAIEETALLASKAYIVDQAPFFTTSMKQRILSENPGVKNLEIENFRYLYDDGVQDDVISMTVKYQIVLDFPMGFDHTIDIELPIKCRAFTGKNKRGDVMSFEEMESEGQWEPVWIFPESGEKYHSENCTYVKANAKEMVLTSSLMKQYTACSLCKPQSMAIGSYVYCFEKFGSVYHRASCKSVDKYVIEINKEDALRKGYEPCSKCGGGQYGDSK